MGTRLVATLLCLLVPQWATHSSQGPRFLPDDPISTDPDDMSIEEPVEVEISAIFDLFVTSFGFKPGDEIPRAVNANTLGEVPDSSWFTNRIGVRQMSIEELVRGPNRHDGPDLSQPITIIAGKSGGISRGFRARDGRGDVYFVKADPTAHPSLATAADVISSKFFHAIGYNVPENYLAYIDPDQLLIGPDAEISRPGGKVKMTEAHLESILEGVARLPDGRVRVVASLQLPGAPVGPFKFYGTRSDDANDVFPHQHRRELRGYKVFCAWLNHDDSRSLNTLDMYVTEEDRSFVKHYLIDFSSTLGAGSNPKREIAPQHARAGNEYLIEIKPALKTALTLGIWERPWMNYEYAYPEYAEAGRIEGEHFEPQLWKAEYPNPAFDRLLLDDAFWAAKIVFRFSDEAIRALIETGEYIEPGTSEFLARILMQRRDKIVDYYFRQLNPLDEFRVEGSRLEFRNLGEEAGVASAAGYDYEWFAFDNLSGELTPLGDRADSTRPSLEVPRNSADYLMVRIWTKSGDVPGWNKGVEVYLANSGEPYVVGADREI